MQNIKFLFAATMLAMCLSANAMEDMLAESNKLWTNLENRILELEQHQKVLSDGFKACKIVLRIENSNSRKVAELDESADVERFGNNAIEALKQDLLLIRNFQNQLQCTRISQQDKSDIAKIVVESFTKSLPMGIPIGSEIVERNTKVCTPDDTVYKFYKFNGTKNEFTFDVEAKNDVHVLLAQESDRNDKSIEIVIGGWGNTKSVIRFGQLELVGLLRNDILNTCEFRSFWVRWNQHSVEVGVAGEEQPFMQTSAGPHFKVNFIGVHTGFGSSGHWKLKN